VTDLTASKLTASERKALAAEIEAELARRSLVAFCQRVYPGFDASPPHIRLLAEKFEAVERGEIKRLIVSLPPGSGKSTLASLATAWMIGRNPKRRIINASATERLTIRNNRMGRDKRCEPSSPFDTSLSADSATHWETREGGGVFGVGVGGTITGFRADVCIVDDAQDGVLSLTERASLEEWFRSKLLTRLEPNGSVIVVQTRWSKDDLPGRLMSGARGKQWEYVCIPALAEEDDILGRAPGEALWPARYSAKALAEIREEIGSKSFEGLYQGHPVTSGGEVFRADWFPRYRPEELPRDGDGALKFDKIVCAMDSASKTGVRNDYSVIVTFGTSNGRHYLLDVRRERVEFPALQRMALATFDRWRPSRFYVEDSSNAVALIQALKSEAHLPIIAIKVTASKESRAEGVSGLCESGRVVLPCDAPWLASFEDELFSFPSADHDDQCDAFVLGLGQLGARKFAYDGTEPAAWSTDDEPLLDLQADPMVAAVARIWGDKQAAAEVTESAMAARVTAKMRGEVY
jgi:predicted phage terminase large subunit-like protein